MASPRCAAAAGSADERALCSGPGKLCEAIGITIAHSELPLDKPPIALFARTEKPEIVDGHPHRHHQGGGAAVALRAEGIEIPEQAVSERQPSARPPARHADPGPIAGPRPRSP